MLVDPIFSAPGKSAQLVGKPGVRLKVRTRLLISARFLLLLKPISDQYSVYLSKVTRSRGYARHENGAATWTCLDSGERYPILAVVCWKTSNYQAMNQQAKIWQDVSAILSRTDHIDV